MEFIAALLMDELIAHQPAAVRLGAVLAGEHLKSEQFPTLAISAATKRFLIRGQRIERRNRRQRWSVLWDAHGWLALTS